MDNETTSSVRCQGYSNPQASKWAAGFRRIVVHPIPRTIQVEFVGAPPQYCFEGYEVRLKDESGLELLFSHIVLVEQMRREEIDSQTFFFGEHNFTDLQFDKYYIPSVIPLERARDGRCLCPVFSTNPFDDRVVCSCIAADWNKVRIGRIEKSHLSPYNLGTIKTPIIANDDISNVWTVFLSLLLVGVTVLLFLLYVVYSYYLRYRASGKMVQIRFIGGQSSSPMLTSLLNCSTPLINLAFKNVLIIYSHDHAIHNRCVLTFAEYLRDVFGFNVHLDVWDHDEIEKNVVHYISSAVLNADKVIIINSVGTYYRYRYKMCHQYYIEQMQPEPFDDLFDKQIDIAILHSSVISMRFKYTSGKLVLPPLACQMQYNLMDNLVQLLSNLSEANMKNDSRLTAFSSSYVRLNACIAEMCEFDELNANWFSCSHRRVPHRANHQDIAGQLEASGEKINTFINDETCIQHSSAIESHMVSTGDDYVDANRLNTLSDDASSQCMTNVFSDTRPLECGNVIQTYNLLNSNKLPTIKEVVVSSCAERMDPLHDSGFISEKDFVGT